MDPFAAAIESRDAGALRAVLAARPELRADIDRPVFGAAAPAIVYCRHDRAMVDVLLEFGADINAHSQFWGRTVGVLADNTLEMRHYLIARGAVPEIDLFMAAVNARDAAALRTLLAGTPALRPHINRPLFHFGGLAIHAARNNRPMIEALLEFGADINARSHWWAGGFGVLDDTEAEQAAWLIGRGAIVDIHAAAGLGRLDTVKAWLEQDPHLVDAPGGDGQRPLHFASTIDIIDLLLDHGADINARDVDHRSTAAQYRVRDTALCRHLIARGADVDIFMAAALGDPVLVERVLAADPASVTARIGHPGYAPVPADNHIYNWRLAGAPTVLLVAARYGRPDVYDLLFARSPVKQRFLAACLLGDETGARAALAAQPALLTDLPADDRGQLAAAAFDNNLPALRLMLTLGFDVNARGGEGFTPVNRAALRGLIAAVVLLLDHGADPELRNQYGGTALETCQWGSLNFRDPQGDYPATADALLRRGAAVANPDCGSEAVQAVLRHAAGRASQD